MTTIEINTEQLDTVFYDALKMEPGIQRTIAVSNCKHWYIATGNLWPALDAKQRRVFDICTMEARQMGIEK